MKKIPASFLCALIALFITSCSSNQQNKDASMQDTTTTGTVVATEEVVFIPMLTEDAIGHASLKHTGIPAKKQPAKAAAKDTMTALPTYPSVSALNKAFADSGYTITSSATTDTAIVSAAELNNTLTVYSVKKNNVEAFQVISDPNDPDVVQQVIIAKKHGADVYNVENGMTVKEAKKIRGEMKHVVKHGKMIFYTDDSNIEYTATLKDGQNGDTVSESELDDLQIDGIVWESKHKRDKAAKA